MPEWHTFHPTATQQMYSQYNGCVWNGYNFITLSGTTTGTPYPTTGNNPYPITGGTDPTTGSPSPTTGQAPVAFCATLDTLQSVVTQGVQAYPVPKFWLYPKTVKCSGVFVRPLRRGDPSRSPFLLVRKPLQRFCAGLRQF